MCIRDSVSTFSRVAAETSPRLRSTRLTVISETPEASETSRKVKGRRGLFVVIGIPVGVMLPLPHLPLRGKLANPAAKGQKRRGGPVAQLDRAAPS